ncbi:prepilin-type N-terminal cleavage/methylation domain-containing protein [Marinomonas sp. C2222]|uniref:Prepilin-type N-terminal cleavage/methylation domain-containing protein n=1 Tax=Marinomonas sargassi TaxID=2984494 RepID=A0ABT2YNI8_9GAMM|nr:prepilin-type N-terminal cleavage/methylation domain-containing protein [Marinomonas sargassi]MCV2401456.1 prepilin-type N-terminal cleavage/methylation domain-containing protein [Marinomonas sargassi]
MKRVSKQRGFGLLEVLIALTIIAIIAGLSVPSLIPNQDKGAIEKTGFLVRQELQRLFDESWLNTKSFQVITSPEGEWSVFSMKFDQWVEDHNLFSNIEDVSYAISLKNLNGSSHSGKIYFMSSGEYTPFELVISNEAYSKTLYGDGINDIKIK